LGSSRISQRLQYSGVPGRRSTLILGTVGAPQSSCRYTGTHPRSQFENQGLRHPMSGTYASNKYRCSVRDNRRGWNYQRSERCSTFRTIWT